MNKLSTKKRDEPAEELRGQGDTETVVEEALVASKLAVVVASASDSAFSSKIDSINLAKKER